LKDKGRLTLGELSQMIGISPEALRYAIESATPFGAMFKKEYVDGKTVYEAVPIEDAYGGEDFY
ncbi:MAG: winged helix-turn-helix domain-containing protein, partial [Prevotellaceae bacterium]|nr:winged helix-turn-helix domain-containing protein [Prevotellaceae bacterium]